MTELKIYASGPDETDKARTEELKRFSAEKQSGPSGEADRRQEVMNRASAELDRRVKKYRLHLNLDYLQISNRILETDPDLARLYAFGFCD